MRAAEIIRGILDLIDEIDTANEPVVVAEPVAINIEAPSDDINHFKQVVDFLTGRQEPQQYANEPNEVVADIAAVTTDAGGGVNGPKDPKDLRGDSIRIFGDN